MNVHLLLQILFKSDFEIQFDFDNLFHFKFATAFIINFENVFVYKISLNRKLFCRLSSFQNDFGFVSIFLILSVSKFLI